MPRGLTRATEQPGLVGSVGPVTITQAPEAKDSVAPSPRSVVSPTARFVAADVSFVSPTQGWATGGGHLLRTKDGGANWTALPRPPAVFAHLTFATPMLGYASAAQGSLWLTRDGGYTWVDGKLRLVGDVHAANGIAWVLAGEGPYPTFYRSPVGTSAWAALGYTPNRAASLDLHGRTAYLMGQEGAGPIAPALGIWTTARTTMLVRGVPTPANSAGVPDSPIGVAPDGTLFLVLAVSNNEGPGTHQLAYTSRDQGATWARTTAPPIEPADVAAIRGTRFGWNQDLYASRNNGPWTRTLEGGSDGRFFRRVVFLDDRHGYALASDGALHLTCDGGHTWRRVRF